MEKRVVTLISEELKKRNLPIQDCRRRGYDNASNMSGIQNGVQALINEQNPLATSLNCGSHSLNLCGVNAAECRSEVTTYYRIYN